jgi:hypothetical protein
MGLAIAFGKKTFYHFIWNVLGFIGNGRMINGKNPIRSATSAPCRKLFHSFAAADTKPLPHITITEIKYLLATVAQ